MQLSAASKAQPTIASRQPAGCAPLDFATDNMSRAACSVGAKTCHVANQTWRFVYYQDPYGFCDAEMSVMSVALLLVRRTSGRLLRWRRLQAVFARPGAAAETRQRRYHRASAGTMSRLY